MFETTITYDIEYTFTCINGEEKIEKSNCSLCDVIRHLPDLRDMKDEHILQWVVDYNAESDISFEMNERFNPDAKKYKSCRVKIDNVVFIESGSFENIRKIKGEPLYFP